MLVKPTPTRYGYLVVCPRCKREHLLERVSEATLIQDGDVDDEFRVEQGKLRPQWICRKVGCTLGPTTLYVDE